MIHLLIALFSSIAFADIKVMVIDTGISKNTKLLGYVQYKENDPNYVDSVGHGTHVAGIIAFGNEDLNDPLCQEVKIFSCKFYDPKAKPGKNLTKTVDCIKKATNLRMNYINYSGGGSEWSLDELNALREYTKIGGKIFVAAGNESTPLEKEPYYPASYAFGILYKKGINLYYAEGLKNMYVVQSQCSKKSDEICNMSNSHPLAFRANGKNVYSTLPNNTFGYMTGTSQATPHILHTVLKQQCKQLYYKKSKIKIVDN